MELRRRSPVPVLSIVTYHHIAEDDPAYPYDRGVADATPAQFRRQIEWLARHGTVVGIDEVIRALDGEPLPKNAVMITFDDGYRSCRDVALPILQDVGVRATFFVATSFIAERRLYWWERIALLLGQSRRDRAQIRYPRAIEFERADPMASHTLTALVKDTHGLDLERFLTELGVALDVEWSHELETQYADGLIMTWDDVRALCRAGMDVESHGRRHRVLQTLDPGDLADDLAGSRRDLEAQIGRPVRAIAYPVGRRITDTPHIRAALVAAGYRLGLTNHSGVNRWWPERLRRIAPRVPWGGGDSFAPVDPFDIRRLATDRAMSDAMFLTQVAVPQLAYVSTHHH